MLWVTSIRIKQHSARHLPAGWCIEALPLFIGAFELLWEASYVNSRLAAQVTVYIPIADKTEEPVKLNF